MIEETGDWDYYAEMNRQDALRATRVRAMLARFDTLPIARVPTELLEQVVIVREHGYRHDREVDEALDALESELGVPTASAV